MTAKDELARRRYEHLVDRPEGLPRASLKPEYAGYYGRAADATAGTMDRASREDR